MASLTWLGHASFELNLEGSIIYLDPWFDQKPRKMERITPSPVKNVDDIKKADYIFISHEHFDHCDAYDVTRISEKTGASVVAPGESLALLGDVHPRRKVEVREGDEFVLHDLAVKVVPARHPQSIDPVGYVIEKKGKSIYFAGDTYEFREMTDIDADAALLPIGGTFTMDVLGAVNSLKKIKASFAIPMHFNTFEKIKADPHDFAQRARQSTKTAVKVLEIGQTFQF
ncbi:metal-dependent hydrolase [Candidatus Micrarchaeota archaeon]|nr:metal-dependent hydrolase [Candidatus Micrarchaeota archaeon]